MRILSVYPNDHPGGANIVNRWSTACFAGEPK